MRLPLAAVVSACLLAACSPPATESSADRTAAPVSSQLATMQEPLLRTAAKKALIEQRIYSPANDNAIEYYLALHARDRKDEATIVALAELQPYAVIAAEQSLQRDELDEAQRLIGMLAAMDPQASALPRLRDERLRREKVRLLAIADPVDDAADDVATAARAAPSVAIAGASDVAMPVTATEPRPTAETTAPVASVVPLAEAAPPVTSPPTRPALPEATASAPTRQPVLIKDATPRYPALALRRGIEGEVEVSFTIDQAGNVSDPRVLRASPAGLFEEAAIAATRFWKFEATGQVANGRRVVAFSLPKRAP